MTLLFATNNIHKLEEARKILSNYDILSMEDLSIHVDIPEDYDTLHENALQKARFIRKLSGMNVFADDTGLEVEALEGRPGVFSARYAGEGCTFEDNVNKVLEELSGFDNRKALFRTVVALIIDDQEHLFDGVIHGSILEVPRGRQGFGYDPVFVPDGYSETFAQMPAEIKNSISHRARALHQLADFLFQNKQFL